MRAASVIGLLLSLFLGAYALAQEGFPLDGTWHGDWGPTGADRVQVVIVMKWDGTNINGIINPGRNSIPFTQASLDPGNWTVRFQATATGSDGSPVSIAAEGTLENLGSYHRTIAGTWSQGDIRGDFRLTRD